MYFNLEDIGEWSSWIYSEYPKQRRRESRKKKKLGKSVCELDLIPELISCHTVSLPHQKTLSSLDLIREPLATMTPICLPPPEAVVSSGRVEKSPHEQEIKFFAKVRGGHRS